MCDILHGKEYWRTVKVFSEIYWDQIVWNKLGLSVKQHSGDIAIKDSLIFCNCRQCNN